MGDAVDRFGGGIDPDTGAFVDNGKFLAPEGTPFEKRALPETDRLGDGVNPPRPYKRYRVVKSEQVQMGNAIPWFGQEGLGLQFKTDESITKLVEKGVLVEI